MDQPILLFLFLLSVHLSASGVVSTTFTLVNKCNYTVWPASAYNRSNESPSLSTTGFVLNTGESTTIYAPKNWSGRIWARTSCTKNQTTGKLYCATGDCGTGDIACDGNEPTPPVTMAEITLNSINDLDFYDVTVVDGYNVPMLVVPDGGDKCRSTGCPADLNDLCPTELKVTSGDDNQVVGCMNACRAFKEPRYCCTGDYATADKCKPTSYSQIFKRACPQAYSYPFDDQTSTFTCASANYTFTFCPASNNTRECLLSSSSDFACDESEPKPPVTKTEIILGGNGDLDSYRVNMVDDYNVPILVVPDGSYGGDKCRSAGCPADLNDLCPTELKVTSVNGKQVVACKSACWAFKEPQYCCTGEYNTVDKCKTTSYSQIFKRACPQAYSYPLDDRTSTFTCVSANYTFTFCPTSNNTSQRLLEYQGLNVGDSLTAGNGTARWLSPLGDFAFGFHQLANELFLLAIWYDKIPNRTIIWYANGDNPAPRGSRLELNDSRGLVLSSPQGLELWRSYFTSGTIYSGFLNDTGNFQLRDQNSVVLWDSFTHPTDTLVPTQIMVLNSNLSSRQGEFNFSRGRFRLHLQEDGNVVLNRISLPSNFTYKPYYNTGTADANNHTNVGLQVVFDRSGFLYVLKRSGEMFYITKPIETFTTDGFYYRATINYDGVFTIAYHPKDPKNGQRWVVAKTIPENICSYSTFTNGEGVCGFNSICTLKDDQRPRCDCPDGYSLIDSNDTYGGCIPRTSFPNASIPNAKKDHATLITVISVLLGSSVFVILMLVGAIGFGFFNNRKKIKSTSINESVVDSNLRNFTFEELAEATSNFREELGRGSCSIVYKGTIEMISVAVKKLDKLFQESDKEFKTEVNVIGRTHHRNLVRLLGYCNEGQHRILVYEFMSNGTLASFLFTHLKPNWNQRVDIALGIARGLVYLHEECCTQIIHCDIKPQNILLDDHYNARISDFGLSKLLLINQSHTETGIRGTKGYVAPDWFRSAPVTAKVDTYSFGVLLLEIICCRKNVDNDCVSEEKGILTDWAYDCYRSKRLDILLENDCEAINDMKSLERFVRIAIWCIQEDLSLRPTMKNVVQMLEGIVEVTNPPSPCLYGSVS